MEYKKSDGEWKDCPDSTISGLAPETYYVRTKAEGTKLDSNSEVLSITAPEQVAAPVFDPAPGTYQGAQNVTITCETAGADIYYTTDGSEPSTSSTKYNGAINISKTTTIKAIAVKGGMTDSEVATAEYNIATPDTPVKPEPKPEPTPEPTPTDVSGTLMAKMTAKGKNKLAVRWNKIKAKGKGKCIVCAYAHNGVSKKIKVTVK